MNAVTPIDDVAVPRLAIGHRNAATHFRLSLLRPIAQIIEAYSADDVRATFATQPFLADYYRELVELVGESVSVAERWREALRQWEGEAPQPEHERLPLLVLRASGMSEVELELLLAVGLIEEDPRFGSVFAQTPSGERRPTVALLLAWWRIDAAGDDRVDIVRQSLSRLMRMGLIDATNKNAPRSEWALCVPTAIWDALRGDVPHVNGLRFTARDELLPLSAYITPQGPEDVCTSLPEVVAESPQQLVVLRGPRNNGRKTLAGAVARELGRSVLIAGEKACEEESQWRLLLALSVIMEAIPVLDLEIAPGVVRMLADADWLPGPVFVVTGMAGAVAMTDGRPVLNISLPLPVHARRRIHWRAVTGRADERTIHALSDSLRLTSGNIRRAALAASRIAALAKSSVVDSEHLRLACRGLQADRLETLATRIDSDGSLADLSVDDATREELGALLARCRHRETLADDGPTFARGGVGVRALLAGPSGTGKTLSARLLATTLRKDLYRIDLGATVNKYLGETEKNLERAFAGAEELDVVLLLDEGDALMTARTDVSSSNDRYANLETNFLLQRMETYGGILLVTSNAAERIDKAFTRRMDAIVHFRLPDEWRRYEILNLHLPRHAIGDELLREIAYRCALTGGQLRNVALHARLLALESGGSITEQNICDAVQREYRKTGGQSPLKQVVTRPASG